MLTYAYRELAPGQQGNWFQTRTVYVATIRRMDYDCHNAVDLACTLPTTDLETCLDSAEAVCESLMKCTNRIGD